MKKKLLASLLIAVVFVCTFVFGANAAATEISTPEQLLELMTETSTNMKGSYVLTKNIDMSEMEGQSPIGTATYKFTGTFDGAGYTISGLNIDTTSDTGTYPYAGLFGLVNKGTIKNLTVEGTITGKQSAGGIAGWARGATIINCHNYATVTTTSTSNGAGGILGFGDFNGTNISVAITNCTNHGNITAGAYAGGIYGLSQERTNTVQSLVITGCKNYGNVTVNSGNVVGGIVGYHRCSATTGANVFTINECANYGAISATSTATNKGNYAGGIIGAALVSNNVTSTTITLTNLYNEGSVNAVNGVYEGGIGAVLRIPLTSTGEDGNLTTSFVLKNWIQNGPETGIGALANAYKAFIEAATTEIEDRKKKAEAEMELKPIGMLFRDIEEYCPAEYYKDKKLYADFDHLKEYISRFMARPLVNLLTGSKEMDKEFNLSGSEE